MRPDGRGIILYDALYCPGGAEKVTLELARGISGTDICVAKRNRQVFTEEALAGIRCFEVARGPDLQMKGWRTLRWAIGFYGALGFLEDYDWAVFSGSVAPFAVHNRQGKRNIYYCHTPPRFAYDLRDYYLDSVARWQRPVLRELAAHVRARYESAMGEMRVIVANSQNVQKRLKRYLGCDGAVVHPPCSVESYRWLGQGGYYLSTARLEPYKRIDLIIEAFRRMPEKRLVVSSGGSDGARLRRLAGRASNIGFVGWQDDEQRRKLVGNAIATLYLPRDEDFGMSPVESMAAGKPVIGVSEGGLLETVVDGETGLLTPPEPSTEDLIAAVRAMTPERAISMRPKCEIRAGLFSRSRFLDRMRTIIAETDERRAA